MKSSSKIKLWEQVFSIRMRQVYFHSVWVLGTFVYIWWPELTLFEFVNNSPLNFLFTALISLIIFSYMMLWIGRGEYSVLKVDFFDNHVPVSPYQSTDENFYGINKFILHTILVHLFSFPILMISATLSGINLGIFFRVLSVLLMTSLLCCFIGAFVYATLNQKSTAGYWLARLGFVFLFGATELIYPYFNPIHLVIKLLQNQSNLSKTLEFSYFAYLCFCALLCLLLGWCNHWARTQRAKAVS